MEQPDVLTNQPSAPPTATQRQTRLRRHWDFLAVVLLIVASLMWKLRKPERPQLEISRADGSRDLQSFVVRPNVSSEVWFYPWNQADLARYFDGEEARWRASPRPAITYLRLLATPLDWVSQQPDTIVIESADAVRMSMAR